MMGDFEKTADSNSTIVYGSVNCPACDAFLAKNISLEVRLAEAERLLRVMAAVWDERLKEYGDDAPLLHQLADKGVGIFSGAVTWADVRATREFLEGGA